MSDYSIIESDENCFTSNLEENINFEEEVVTEEENDDEIIFQILKDIKNYKNENCINFCEYIDNVNLEQFIFEI